MTRFPNGIETSNLKVTGASILGAVTASSVTAPVIGSVVTLDLTDSVALTDAQKAANIFVISKAGSLKVLTLGMPIGREITIINEETTNAVKIKNIAADTGVNSTNAKTAKFITIASGEGGAGGVAKVTADA